MATISAPEILVSSSLWSWRVEPRPVAVSPSRMKIAEKLATKSRLGPSTRRQSASSSSAAETPVTAER